MNNIISAIRQTVITFLSSGQIILSIPDKSYLPRRTIGNIENGILIVKRTRAKHYFRIYKGFAFCYELIAYHQDKFNLISVIIDGRAFYVTPQVIMSCGIAKKFTDLELQIILPEKNLSTSPQQAYEYQKHFEVSQNKICKDSANLENKLQINLFERAV